MSWDCYERDRDEDDWRSAEEREEARQLYIKNTLHKYEYIIKCSDHNTFFVWRKRMREQLQRDDVWDVVSGELQNPQDPWGEERGDDGELMPDIAVLHGFPSRQQKYDMKVDFARAALLMTVPSNKWPNHVYDIAEIWESLQRHGLDSIHQQAYAYRDFQNLRYKDSASQLEAQLRERADQLNEMSGRVEITDKLILYRLLDEVNTALGLNDKEHICLWMMEDHFRPENRLDEKYWRQRILKAAGDKEREIREQERSKNAKRNRYRRRNAKQDQHN